MLVEHLSAQAEALLEDVERLGLVLAAGVNLLEARGRQHSCFLVPFKLEARGADQLLEGQVVARVLGGRSPGVPVDLGLEGPREEGMEDPEGPDA